MLLALSDDALGVIFEGLRNVLEPCVAVALSSTCHGLLAPTQAMRQQLQAEHAAAAALCVKVGLRSCKELREARQLTAASRVTWVNRSITAANPQSGITAADIRQHNQASMEEMFLFFTAVDLATLNLTLPLIPTPTPTPTPTPVLTLTLTLTRPTWRPWARWARCCRRSRSCTSVGPPAPQARCGWWRSWAQARCRPWSSWITAALAYSTAQTP